MAQSGKPHPITSLLSCCIGVPIDENTNVVITHIIQYMCGVEFLS